MARRQAAVPGSSAMRSATQQTARQRATSSGAKARREGPRPRPGRSHGPRWWWPCHWHEARRAKRPSSPNAASCLRCP
eukprot:3166619-Alexandrium_andersonii.AAC.1